MDVKVFCERNLPKKQEWWVKKIYSKAKFLYHRFANPEYVLKKMFKEKVGYELDLNAPKTFNEKLQWLKLYDHNPLYTTLVDKYAVKQYVADRIGEQYIIPTLGVWNNFDEINFDDLPNKFVLKCTHDSGSVVVVLDKEKMVMEDVRRKLEYGLSRNYYYNIYEWPYKNVPPRIIAEQYMTDGNNIMAGTENIADYKLMCFNGKVRCTFTCTDRWSDDGLKVTFFDNDWEQMPFERHYPAAELGSIPKPVNFEMMKNLAEKLADGIVFVRVDFYEINNKVYFGEMTFYPGSGIEEFYPEQYDRLLGDWIKLPRL